MSREPSTAAVVVGRFWSKVDRRGSAECWPWMAGTFKARYGYGQFYAGTSRADRQTVAAHRYAWLATHGSIPAGLHVLHRCDNPPCCNPRHLFLGTQKDNNADAVNKGRHHSSYTDGRAPVGEAHPRAVFTRADVLRIRASGETIAALAREMGVSRTAVSQVRNRKTWRHVDDVRSGEVVP